MNQYDDTGKSIIGVQQVNENETHRYGIVDPAESNEGLLCCNKYIDKLQFMIFAKLKYMHDSTQIIVFFYTLKYYKQSLKNVNSCSSSYLSFAKIMNCNLSIYLLQHFFIDFMILINCC